MTSPLIFKRTKTKPTHRRRDTSPDDTKPGYEETQDFGSADVEQSPSTLAVKLKNKAKKNKAKSKLSFGGDEEVSVHRLLYDDTYPMKGRQCRGFQNQEIKSEPENCSWKASVVCVTWEHWPILFIDHAATLLGLYVWTWMNRLSAPTVDQSMTRHISTN